MSDVSSLTDFLDPVDRFQLSHDEGYPEGQIGRTILANEGEIPDLDSADIVLVGCGEQRGDGNSVYSLAPDVIRSQFYELYYWHKDIQIADIGNIKCGATLADSYAALRTVVGELINIGKTVIILGGSHDLTLAQYDAYKSLNRIIEATTIDGLIDLKTDSPLKSKNFLMEMLTGEPNFIRHYNHIAFQSYLVHPGMLETLDKLRFDCYRLGNVKEHIDEMEPVLRNSQMLSFDISALQYTAAPSNFLSPNGLNGEEACSLTRYAGMSPNMNSLGIYGYSVENDTQQLTAKQIAQMLWYFIDGMWQGRHEVLLAERESFFEFNTAFAEIDTVFLQSKKTGRWWMQLPDKSYIACSYQDYIQASSNEIPERWLRAQERS
ncbi:MAG: formimidoylglutamase [Sphingobacteriales bacterium]|nr:formimidoylglutamase [Sphingobacteriales bacterium]